MTYLSYLFDSNAAGTLLENAAAETGGPFTDLGGPYVSGHLCINATGDVYNDASGGEKCYYTGAATPTGGCRISATISKRGENVGSVRFGGFAGTAAAFPFTGYFACRDNASNLWRITKGYDPIGSASVTATMANDSSAAVDLDIAPQPDGSVLLTLWINGSILLQASDTTSPLTSGRFAIYISGGTSATVGTMVAGIAATDIPAPTNTTEYLSAAPATNAVTLTLGNAQSGGAYALYRSLDPTFAVGAGTLRASGITFPYADAVADDQPYFYRVVNTASGITGQMGGIPSITGGPYNTAGHRTIADPTFATGRTLGPINLVTMGDSLVQDSTNSPSTSQACATALAAQSGNAVALSNQGLGGTGTVDWQPGGTNYNAAKAAANSLVTANPVRQLVFLLKLGTNDSTASGNSNGTLSKAVFKSNYKATIDQLISDFPSAKISLPWNTYFTPNSTINSYVWDETSQKRVLDYNAAISELVGDYSTSNPGKVYLGDTQGYVRWVSDFLTICASELGGRGTCYLHPNQSGSNLLGGLWAVALYNALSNSPGGAIYPPAGQVLAGVHYGPTGGDYTGTFVTTVGLRLC